MITARIPYMTDPLGAHWRQPKGLRDRVQVYQDYVTIQERDWLALPRYDRSNPSGVYAGKAWRCQDLFCWMGKLGPDGSCWIIRKRALVCGPGTNLTYKEPTTWTRT